MPRAIGRGVKVRQPFLLSQFRGWNDDQNNAALDDRDLRTANNVFLERANLLRSRYGFYIDPFGAALNSGADITGIYDFKSESDAKHFVVVVAGTKVYAEDNSGDPSTVTDITAGTGPPTGVPEDGPDKITTGVVFKDQLLLCQSEGTTGVIGGSIVPTSYDNDESTSATLSGWYSDDRKPELIHSQWNFVFTAGYNTGASPTAVLNPMTVNHSELNDANTWLEFNYVDKIGGISTYGDEYVTALFRHRDFLMIGTNKRIYPISYTGVVGSRFIVQRPLEVGVAHQRSVVSINGEFTFFMDPRGRIHTIREAASSFGDVGISDISRKVRNYVNSWTRNRIRFVHGVFDQKLGTIVWFVNNGTEALVLDVNNFPLEEPDPRLASWFKWTNVSANASAMLSRDSDPADTDTAAASRTTSEPDSDGSEAVFFGTKTGWLKRFSNSVSFDESDAEVQDTIATRAETKYFDFAVPDSKKKVVRVDWNMLPASTNPGPSATWLYDFGRTQSNTVTIDMDTSVGTVNLYNNGVLYNDGATYGGASSLTAKSKTRFINGGTFASLQINQFLSGTTQWKLQSAVALVERSGAIRETE